MSKRFEKQFGDYIEGRLSPQEVSELEQALSRDSALNQSFEGYKKVVSVSKDLSSRSYELAPGFAVKVMDKVSEVGFLRRLYMKIKEIDKRLIYGALTASLVVAVMSQVASQRPAAPWGEPPVRQTPLVGETSSHSTVVVPAQVNRAESGVVARSEPREDAKPKDSKLTELLVQKSEERDKIERSNVVVPKALMDSAGAPSGKELSAYNQKRAPAAVGGIDMLQMQPVAPQLAYDISMPQPADRENYHSYDENGRIEARTQPVSTFSIDVDTGSYTNVRRFLSMGQLPPKDAVRIEEFLNYFDYNYPVQHEQPFTLSYEIARSPLEKDRYLLKLGIKAKDMTVTQKPWNLVFLVDVSGSMMDADKLPLVKQSLTMLANQMRAQDRIALVTYAGAAGLVLDSTTGTEKQKVLDAISRLEAGGSTNGASGINLAYQVAEQHKLIDGVNRVVLATDGDFNVGITDFNDLIKLIEEKRSHNVTLTTLGFGKGNIQEATMEQLADKGNGNYFYLDSFKEARKVLETQLLGTIEVVAKDVKLQIDFNPLNVAQYRLIGYENRKLKNEDFHNDKIDAGEIGSGHTVTALYEIVLTGSELEKKLSTDSRYNKSAAEPLPALSNEHQAELAFLKIRFKEPEADVSKLLEFPIAKKDLIDDSNKSSDDFRFASAVSYFGHLLKDSQFKGDYTAAQIIELAQGAKGEDKFGYRQEFIELVRNYSSLVK